MGSGEGGILSWMTGKEDHRGHEGGTKSSLDPLLLAAHFDPEVLDFVAWTHVLQLLGALVECVCVG